GGCWRHRRAARQGHSAARRRERRGRFVGGSLSKLRVHEMAGEFGISADEVITLLRQMDVPVRSHLSMLTDDQVARVRARWEREKRARAERQAAPPATTRRRRSTAVAAPEPVAAAAAGETGIRRRRRSEVVAPVGDVEEIAPAEADVDVSDTAELEIEAPVEIPSERRPAPERAATAPVEVSPAPEELISPRMPAAADVEERHVPPPRPAELTPAATAAPAAPAAPSRPSVPSGPPDRPRPRPITPGAPRPRPVASGTPFMPPRPVASAAPGGGTATPTRRDDRQQPGPSHPERGRRKKGKRGAVDQEAVDANISKTMAAMRGAPS